MDLGKLVEMSQRRKCRECGAEFVGTEKSSALEQYSDHSTIHNPSGAQWSKAYSMIQEGRERAKRGEGRSTQRPVSAGTVRE